eukprot:753388-Hanusia_phi.AAC.10
MSLLRALAGYHHTRKIFVQQRLGNAACSHLRHTSTAHGLLLPQDVELLLPSCSLLSETAGGSVTLAQ